MSRALLLPAALLVAFAPLGAQDDRKPPRRPELAAEADTNSALAYYDHGMDNVQKRPSQAADAFYWASRLAPGWADPLYARWAALHLSQPRQRRLDYYAGKRHAVEAEEIQRIDSLLYRAYLMNPFTQRRLDRLLLEQLVPGDDWYFFQRELEAAARQDPVLGAWYATTAGRYRDALRYYGTAIKRYPKAHHLRSERARAYFLLAMHDSAIVDLTTVIERMRERDEEDVVYLYQSKAMLEYSVGTIWVNRGQPDSARAAFERALVEDLSFHAAHQALSAVALAQGDTATAVSELDLAVQISPENGLLRYQHALMLVAQNKAMEALAQLQRAAELEPYFADPYFVMARLHDHAGFTTEAMQGYASFIAHAQRSDRQRLAFASARHAALQSEPPTPATPSAPAAAEQPR